MAETKKKLEKRAFYDVRAPFISQKISLYGASPQALHGQVVTFDLTRSLRGKSLELKLRVHAKGDQLEAVPLRLSLAGSYVRRMMRKGSDYVEDSFNAESKDSQVLVKPFLITRHKVSRAIRKDLRDTARKYLEAHCKTRTVHELFGEIMSNKIQKELSIKLKKVYPLALCEIRFFGILEPKKEII